MNFANIDKLKIRFTDHVIPGMDSPYERHLFFLTDELDELDLNLVYNDFEDLKEFICRVHSYWFDSFIAKDDVEVTGFKNQRTNFINDSYKNFHTFSYIIRKAKRTVSYIISFTAPTGMDISKDNFSTRQRVLNCRSLNHSYIVKELNNNFYVIKSYRSDMGESVIAVGTMDFLEEFIKNHKTYEERFALNTPG